MSVATRLKGLAILVGVAAVGGLALQGAGVIDAFPPSARVTPSTKDGRFILATGTWDAPGGADIEIRAGSGEVPPACGGGRCTTSPYKARLQVHHGDTVVITVYAHALRGRASCYLQRPGERFDAVPRPGRAESTTGGTVTCTRSVDW